MEAGGGIRLGARPCLISTSRVISRLSYRRTPSSLCVSGKGEVKKLRERLGEIRSGIEGKEGEGHGVDDAGVGQH